MQIRLSLRGWKRLKKDFVPKPLPDVFWDDDEWISQCMRKGNKADTPAINNFFVTNQWKFLLIGEKGGEKQGNMMDVSVNEHEQPSSQLEDGWRVWVFVHICTTGWVDGFDDEVLGAFL
ncbi:Gibberellin 20 oxidase 1 [Durusdinium trenchii]|uniref:Gibberellin 20 oxidase 1 n=1 Tax=Durusdinium trenchii TaxID=1381693 RepID=A0ABP0RCI4_9DINO